MDDEVEWKKCIYTSREKKEALYGLGEKNGTKEYFSDSA